jgi:hypothetical protein
MSNWLVAAIAILYAGAAINMWVTGKGDPWMAAMLMFYAMASVCLIKANGG